MLRPPGTFLLSRIAWGETNKYSLLKSKLLRSYCQCWQYDLGSLDENFFKERVRFFEKKEWTQGPAFNNTGMISGGRK
ncbi:MAG: hypothetical protein JWM28_4005 [Chitinophagaceae bacterium]|nr:hypothetical protein [Chitinophagaceae bacterium]